MLPSVGRTYHDPLHGGITLAWDDPTEVLLIRLIDTPAFQRLRRIRQLGPASLTFHGAEGSRFTHSLGVMAIARRVFDGLVYHYPELRPYRAAVLCGALLHDLGHGPFSHTSEEIFGNHHEAWTCRILRDYPPIRHLLETFQADLVTQLEQIYAKEHPIPLVWQLVSSQLDCDRLDYLMRDSYFTGATYGHLDLDRIIKAIHYDPASQQLVVARKGMAAIEHYLVVRYFMYTQVYHHPKNLAASWILQHAFARARCLLEQGKIEADSIVTAWLTLPMTDLTLEHYLGADDGVFSYHLQRWQQCEDRVLADLCRRYGDRDLLKALEMTEFKPEQQQQMLAQLRQWLVHEGWEPEPYGGIRVALGSGYTLYQRGIKVYREDGLQEISELSPLVKTLTQPWRRTWLMYPKEFEVQLRAWIKNNFNADSKSTQP